MQSGDNEESEEDSDEDLDEEDDDEDEFDDEDIMNSGEHQYMLHCKF